MSGSDGLYRITYGPSHQYTQVEAAWNGTNGLNIEFYTTTFGFPYKISGIYKNGTGPMASFTYHNDLFHDCFINSITLTPNSTEASEAYIEAMVSVNCTLYEDFKPFTVALEVSAVILTGRGASSSSTSGVTGMPLFLSLDQKQQASLYWGQTMMAFNSNLLFLTQLNLNRYDYLSDFVSQYSNLTSFPDSARGVEATAIFGDGRGGDSGSGVVRFGDFAGPTIDEVLLDGKWASTFAMDMRPEDQILSFTSEYISNTSDRRVIGGVIVDGLAKSLYSSVLTDLGQASNTNILMSPQKTMEFYMKTLQMAEEQFGLTAASGMATSDLMFVSSDPPEAIDGFYSWSGIAEPFVNATTISMQYLCQVPKLKSTGSLILSIIVADLVFLQVLWFILNWATTFVLERRHPQANYCSGCAKTMHEAHDEDAEVTTATTSPVTSVIVRTKSYSPPSSDYHEYGPLPTTVSRTSTSSNRSISSISVADRNQESDEQALTDESIHRSGGQ